MKRPRRSMQFLQMRRVLDLVSIREIPGVQPRTLEIRGNRMDLTSAVELNDTTAPGFVVVSAGQLLVQIPSSITGRILTAAVYSNYVDPAGKSVATYDLGSHPKISFGKARVFQNFVKMLLTTPGTDVWSPNTGGGMRAVAAVLPTKGGDQAISGDIESRVLQVARQMLRSQATDTTLLAEERLLSVNVINITISSLEQRVRLDLALKFHDGKSLTTGVVW